MTRPALLLATLLLAACTSPAAPPTGEPTTLPTGTPGSTVSKPPNASPATAEPTASVAPVPSGGQTDAVMSQARTIVAELDRLAALDNPGLEQLVDWFNSVTADNRSYGVPELEAYFAAQEALFQALQQGASVRQPIADLLALRNPIAALAGIAAVGRSVAAAPTPPPDPADYRQPSSTEWAAIVANPEAYVGARHIVAVCIDGPASLTTMIGPAWFEWRQDYWEGDDAAFSADEDVIMAIAGSGEKRITAYVTVLGWYEPEFGDGERFPHFQLDIYEDQRGCVV